MRWLFDVIITSPDAAAAVEGLPHLNEITVGQQKSRGGLHFV